MCARRATSSRRRPGGRRGPSAGSPTVTGVSRSRCSRRNLPSSTESTRRAWRAPGRSARYRQGLPAPPAQPHRWRMTQHGILAGKIAPVTGASRGIGAAAARLFAREGATVVLAARTEDALKNVAASLDGASYVVADFGSLADIERTVDTVLERHGRLDVAFNNAGVGVPPHPVVDFPEDDFDLVMRVNFKGVYFAVSAEVRAMLRTGGGAIVNMSRVGR